LPARAFFGFSSPSRVVLRVLFFFVAVIDAVFVLSAAADFVALTDAVGVMPAVSFAELLTVLFAAFFADFSSFSPVSFAAGLGAFFGAVFFAAAAAVSSFFAAGRVRAMKTRWGSCSTRTASITLNLALARYERRALVYVILHELTHLWVRGHGAVFHARMDRYLPDWRDVRRVLNAQAREDEEGR